MSGAYDARELFAAVQVPLLHDRPWARDMALNIGLRWSDFSSFDSHTTWQAGLRWQPAEELTLRANYAEVFRAPSLAELYEPAHVRSSSLTSIRVGMIRLPDATGELCGQRRAGWRVRTGAVGLVVVYGGNPELEPETGHTLGAGLIYTPVWAKGLSASVDYFQVELVDHIWQTRLPTRCCSNARSVASVAPAKQSRRLPDGRVQSGGDYLPTTSGSRKSAAFDFAINWSAMTRIGEVNSSLLATYLDRWDEQPFPGGEVYSYAGNFDAGARPRWRASGHLDWHSGPWMASYAAEYIGSYSEHVEPWPPFGIEFEPFDRRVDPVLYHDIEAGFKFDSGVTVRAAITNVTDEDPPYLNIAPANTDVATYRLLGRSYFLELRYQVE